MSLPCVNWLSSPAAAPCPALQLKRMFEDLKPAFPQLLRSRRRWGWVAAAYFVVQGGGSMLDVAQTRPCRLQGCGLTSATSLAKRLPSLSFPSSTVASLRRCWLQRAAWAPKKRRQQPRSGRRPAAAAAAVLQLIPLRGCSLWTPQRSWARAAAGGWLGRVVCAAAAWAADVR